MNGDDSETPIRADPSAPTQADLGTRKIHQGIGSPDKLVGLMPGAESENQILAPVAAIRDRDELGAREDGAGRADVLADPAFHNPRGPQIVDGPQGEAEIPVRVP